MDNNNNGNGRKKYVEARTRLQHILNERGVMQKDVAEWANIEKYQMSQICSGQKTNIMLDTAKKICRALGVTLDEAFGDD
jgi:DNA-binding Xre family transcriptional regulator